jgi:hypothetical protein
VPASSAGYHRAAPETHRVVPHSAGPAGFTATPGIAPTSIRLSQARLRDVGEVGEPGPLVAVVDGWATQVGSGVLRLWGSAVLRFCGPVSLLSM